MPTAALQPHQRLYGWVDLQPDRKVRSVYTQDEFDPAELIEEAARIHEERESLRATGFLGPPSRSSSPTTASTSSASPGSTTPSRCAGTCTTSSPASASATASAGTRRTPTFPTTSRSFARAAARRKRPCSSRRPGKGRRARDLLLPAPLPRAAALLGRGDRDAAPVARGRAGHAYERHRNAAIFERQGNRNPLIDHPEWAARIDFGAPAG